MAFTTQENKSISEAESDLISYQVAREQFYSKERSRRLLKVLA